MSDRFPEKSPQQCKLTLYAKDLKTANELVTHAEEHLRRAIERIITLEGRLNHRKPLATISKFGQRYFLNDLTNQRHLNSLREVLVLVKNGLNGQYGPVTIKAGEEISNFAVAPGKKVVGEVIHRDIPNPGDPADVARTMYEEGITKREFDKKYGEVKPHHNWVMELGVQRMVRSGAIKMLSSELKDKKEGLVTFIHEATHKYAGTIDNSYFIDDPDPWVVHRPETPGNLRTVQDALKNADSYAWFVVKGGGKWGAHKPKANG
jgi:hypothetical protein